MSILFRRPLVRGDDAAALALARVGNALLSRLERGRRACLLSRPTALILHVTDRCTLHCVMCMNASGSALEWPREGQHQRSLDFSQECLDVLLRRFPLARSVCFAGVGEPLLNPELADMAAMARRRGLRTELITNGTELADNLHWLGNGSLDSVEVSVNAVDNESMARDCRGGSRGFARLCDGLDGMVRIREEFGHPQHLSLSAVLWKSRLPDATGFIDFAASHGVARLTFHNLIPSSLTGCGLDEVLDHRDAGSLAELAVCGKKTGVAVVLPAVLGAGSSEGELARCTSPWRTLYVDADGGVSGCFRIESPSCSNGDWRRPGIWNNAYFRSLRGAHLSTRSSLPSRCQTCVETACQ